MTEWSEKTAAWHELITEMVTLEKYVKNIAQTKILGESILYEFDKVKKMEEDGLLKQRRKKDESVLSDSVQELWYFLHRCCRN